MRFFPEEGYKRLFVFLLYGSVGFALVYVIFRYLFSALLPFLIAFLVALLLRRPTLAVSKMTKMPRKAVAALLAVLFVSLLLGGIGYAVWKLVNELGEFAGAVISGENALLVNLQNMFTRIGDFAAKFPLLNGQNAGNVREQITTAMLDMAKNMAMSLGTKLPEAAGAIASAVPQTVIFCVVTILSAVYFCADYEDILDFFRRHLQGKSLEIAQKLHSAAGKTLACVMKSYAVLFLFTFAELLLGFMLLRLEYAFLLALLTAFVDSLPIFGTGTVLLPLALYHFFTGTYSTAIGLCILYAVVVILRQILEPRILGAGVGMHPLLMLMAMYVGLKLFGVLGMILLPAAAVVAKNVLKMIRSQGKENARGKSS